MCCSIHAGFCLPTVCSRVAVTVSRFRLPSPPLPLPSSSLSVLWRPLLLPGSAGIDVFKHHAVKGERLSGWSLIIVLIGRHGFVLMLMFMLVLPVLVALVCGCALFMSCYWYDVPEVVVLHHVC